MVVLPWGLSWSYAMPANRPLAPLRFRRHLQLMFPLLGCLVCVPGPARAQSAAKPAKPLAASAAVPKAAQPRPWHGEGSVDLGRVPPHLAWATLRPDLPSEFCQDDGMCRLPLRQDCVGSTESAQRALAAANQRENTLKGELSVVVRQPEQTAAQEFARRIPVPAQDYAGRARWLVANRDLMRQEINQRKAALQADGAYQQRLAEAQRRLAEANAVTLRARAVAVQAGADEAGCMQRADEVASRPQPPLLFAGQALVSAQIRLNELGQVVGIQARPLTGKPRELLAAALGPPQRVEEQVIETTMMPMPDFSSRAAANMAGNTDFTPQAGSGGWGWSTEWVPVPRTVRVDGERWAGRGWVGSLVGDDEVALASSLPRPVAVSPDGQAGRAYLEGLRHYRGEGVPVNEEKGAALHRQAADAGYAPAQLSLAWAYLNGRGVPADIPQAVHWFKKVAEQGLPQAQLTLGKLYATGRHLPQDDALAAQWFQRAAEGGVAEGGYALAMMVLLGRGVAQDDARAARLLQLAAEQGRTDAQTALAALYMEGRGVKADQAVARQWLRKASDQGYEPAKTMLRDLR